MANTQRIQYVIKRLLYSVFTVWAVTLVVFLLMHIAPGNPVDLLLSHGVATQEMRQQVIEQFHLNDPWYVQYGSWLWDVLHGDFGYSYSTQRPVWGLIRDRGPITALIVLMSMVFTLVISIPLGVVAGTNYQTKLDRLLTTISVVGVSVPVFVSSVLSLLVFSFYLGVMPATAPSAGALSLLPYLVLPSLLLAFWVGAVIFRMTRAGMRDVLQQDYIRTSTAMGIPRRKILLKYAAKNALAPIMTISALWTGILIVSALVVEYVFGIGGLGLLTVKAATSGDFPVLLANTLLIALVFVVLNFVVDVLYSWVDPRVALGQE